jgi:hypothetical protein
MPIERRDASGAKIFMPTQSERVQSESLKQLQKGLAEVDEMKKQLQQMMEALSRREE